MSDFFSTAMDRMSRIPGVRGALLVDLQTGVPVVAELGAGVNGKAVAALTSSLFQRTGRAAETAEFGSLSTLQLEAEDGHVVIARAGEIAVVAVAEPDAQIGLVRLEAHKTAEAIR